MTGDGSPVPSTVLQGRFGRRRIERPAAEFPFAMGVRYLCGESSRLVGRQCGAVTSVCNAGECNEEKRGE
jgi:hypothetical protein